MNEEEELIDKAMDIDPLRFYEDAEQKINELKNILKYF
jgi:hypothetical protein